MVARYYQQLEGPGVVCMYDGLGEIKQRIYICGYLAGAPESEQLNRVSFVYLAHDTSLKNHHIHM